MKKKALLAAAMLAALAVPQVAGAEGFGLVEWSAQGTAMGGARMFAENDAAMLAYNPASITKIEKGAVAIHGTQISPHGRYDVKMGPMKVEKNNHNTINPGKVPSIFYVKKVQENDWVGIGAFTRFGMISEFKSDSLAAYSARRSKMIGTSITPTYAHKFDSKWSAAVGAEFNYVDLALDRKVPFPGHDHMKVQGDTWAIGWNAAANYAFDDKNEIGVVYRSKISQKMKGAHMHYGSLYGKAEAKVVLPDQWSIGYNHKFNDKTRVELNAMYTRWSTYESLDMKTSMLGQVNSPKNWSNGWRYAIGVEHKLSNKYNLLAGYSYDGAVIPKKTADFMIPTGNRKTISLGTEYHDRRHTLAATVGYMFIGDKDITINGPIKAHTRDNNAPIFSIGYQYNF